MTRPTRLGFGTRLFASSVLIVVVTVVTAGVVAILIAPSMFHDHLHQAGIGGDQSLLDHVEMAFRGTLVRAWAPAVAVAVVAALAVSWWISRRVQRSVERVAESAGAIARGHYDTRVHPSGLGQEFDALALAVNELARRLDETETTRRRMLADLGHELRTPIATIDSHLEAIEDGVRAADADTIAVLRTGTRRLARLADDVRDVSRVQEGRETLRPEPTSARTVTDSAVAMAAPAYAAAGIELRVDGDDVPLIADPARLGQVLGNLLDNARRHTPSGGTVAVRTGAHAGSAVFDVRDTGDGIAADRLPHVFDRFYRADDARVHGDGGSGIGLTIVRALVVAHGGTVTAHSDGEGRGAAFTVTMPVAGPPGERR